MNSQFPILNSQLTRKLRSAVFWLLWLLLISSPFLWIRIQFDLRTRQYLAHLNSERWSWWREWFRELPSHWGVLLVLGLMFFAMRRVFKAGIWRRFLDGFSGLTRALGKTRGLKKGFVSLFLACLIFLVCGNLNDQERGWGIFVGIYMILAMGLNLTVGMTGLLVLGYAAFYAMGAYTFGLLQEHWKIPFWIAFFPAALAGALVGLLLGLPSIRLRGDYLAIVTLGFGEVLRILLINLEDFTGGSRGIEISPGAKFPKFGALSFSLNLFSRDGAGFSNGISREATGFLAMSGLVILSFWLIRNLVHSRIGRAWIAIREDETAAAAMGISTYRLKLLAFALSAAWAAVGGVCFAAYQGYIDPESFGFTESILVLSMVILGGMGTVAGPALGAAVFYLGYELLRSRLPCLTDYRLMIFGGLMVLMMVFRPQGLFGSQQRKIEIGGREG